MRYKGTCPICGYTFDMIVPYDAGDQYIAMCNGTTAGTPHAIFNFVMSRNREKQTDVDRMLV